MGLCFLVVMDQYMKIRIASKFKVAIGLVVGVGVFGGDKMAPEINGFSHHQGDIGYHRATACKHLDSIN